MNFKDKKKTINNPPVHNARGSDPQVTDVKENTATPAIEEGSLNPLAKRETKNIVSGSHLESIDIDLIDPSPYQPRIMNKRVYEKLPILAADIEINGQINPITVRQKGNRYELIAGERRFRAIKEILKLKRITALVKTSMNDDKAAITALLDNTARHNLTDFESILKIKQLCEEFGYPFESYEFVTEKFAIDKSKYFRLKYILDLPEFILDSLNEDPELISGYIAQEVNTAINKALETKTEKAIFDLLRPEWDKYVEEFKSTGKRHKGFIAILSEEEKANKATKPEKTEEATTEEQSSKNKFDFKTDKGVKFGSMSSECGTKGKSVLKLRVALDADITEEKARKIEEFFKSLND